MKGGAISRRNLPRRFPWLTAATGLILAAATVAATLGARAAVTNQEEALLDDRANEVKAFLETALNGVVSNLSAVGGALRAGGIEGSGFDEVAVPLVTQEVFDYVALVDVRPDPPVVVRAEGSGVDEGEALSAGQAEAARSAQAQLTSTDVIDVEGQQRLGLAVGAPLVPEGFAVYAENEIVPISEQPREPGSPFAEVEVALYAGASADRGNLIIATVEPPLEGRQADVTVEFGAEEWLMEVVAREPLAGGLTERMPWLVAGLGALVTLATVALIEAVQRRRDYALALVEERTQELEAAVVRLEHARLELEEADRLKDEFLDLAAHELRTPIAAIAGFAEVLTSGNGPDPETRARLVGRIWANAREMEELTNQLLDLSRLRAGRVEIKPEALALRGAVEECLERVGAALEDRPVSVEVPADLAALADASAFRRILTNLLTNAAKFSDPGTPVSVTAGVEGDDVRVAVTDQGIGIAPEEQALIFERFYRADSGSHATRGSGVGLAIVGQYVALHGGRIGVDSTPGSGSTFWFTLPMAREEATVS